MDSASEMKKSRSLSPDSCLIAPSSNLVVSTPPRERSTEQQLQHQIYSHQPKQHQQAKPQQNWRWDRGTVSYTERNRLVLVADQKQQRQDRRYRKGVLNPSPLKSSTTREQHQWKRNCEGSSFQKKDQGKMTRPFQKQRWDADRQTTASELDSKMLQHSQRGIKATEVSTNYCYRARQNVEKTAQLQSQRRGWGHHHRRYFQQSHMNQNSFHEIPPMQPKEIRHSSTPNHGNYCLVQRNSSEQKVFQRFSKAVPSESSTLFMTSQSSARNRDNEKSPVTRPQQQHNLNTNSQTQGTRPPSTDKVLIANRQAIRDIDNKNDGQCDLEEGRNFGIKHSYHHQLQVTPPPQGNSKKSEQSGTKGSWGKHGFLSASKNSSTPQKYRTTTQKKQWGTPTVTLSATIDPGSFSTSKGSLSTEQKASQPPPTFSHSTPYQLVKKKERKEHCGSAKLHMMEHDLKSQCDGQHEKETAGDDGCKKKRLKRKKSTKVTFAENGEILGRYHDSSDNLPNTGANFSPKLPSRSSLWGMTIPRKAAYQPSVQIDTKDLCNASKTLKLPSKLRLDEAENNGANPSKIPKRKNIVKGGKETPTKARCGEEERSDSKTGEKRKTATKVAPEPSQIHQLKRKRGGGGECELHCHPLNLVVEDMLRIITATRRAKQGRKTGHCNDANKGVPKESVHTHDDWDRPEIRNQARLQLMRRYVAAARTGMDPNEFTRRLLKYVLASDEETATDSTKTKQMRLKSYTHMPIEQQNQNL